MKAVILCWRWYSYSVRENINQSHGLIDCRPILCGTSCEDLLRMGLMTLSLLVGLQSGSGTANYYAYICAECDAFIRFNQMNVIHCGYAELAGHVDSAI